MVFIRKAINYKLYNMKILVTFNKIANVYKNLSSNIYRVVLLKTKIIGANNRMKITNYARQNFKFFMHLKF